MARLAIMSAMHEELAALLERLRDDESVRVLVLRGERGRDDWIADLRHRQCRHISGVVPPGGNSHSTRSFDGVSATQDRVARGHRY